MRSSRSLVVLFSAVAVAAALPSCGRAQADSRPVPSAPDPQTDSRPVQSPADPRTDSQPTQSKPDPRTDSTPTPPQGNPDLRTDSKPKTGASPETDSRPYYLGSETPVSLDLGFDPNTTAPMGMVATNAAGSPLLLYLSLEHRSAEAIAPADAALVASRKSDLDRAARLRGYDLKQAGWVYQQAVCPETEGSSGVLVLRFVRAPQGGEGIESSFTAIVPRDGRDVRVIAVVHRKRPPSRADFHGKRNGAAVNEAIPAPALFGHLEPRADWLAAGACIAEIAGASPHIPNDPDLDAEDRILSAPSPLLRLLLNGDRKVYFTDREDPDHYSIWDEWVEHKGEFKEAKHQRYDSPVLAVTNPPVPLAEPVVIPAEPPVAHPTPVEAPIRSVNPAEPPVLPVTQPPVPASITLNPPQPPVVMKPLPPSPLSGDQQ